MRDRSNDFAAYTGVVFGVIAIFIAIRLFENALVLPGMDVGEEHKAFTLARMYGILTGLPIGGGLGFAVGTLIKFLFKRTQKEKAL